VLFSYAKYEEERGYILRDIVSSDFFAFTRIIKKMGIREELKKIAKYVASVKAEDKDVATNEMQIELIMIFIENVANAEAEVFKFVSDISEKSVEDLKDPMLFIESLKEILESESIKSFFSLALK